VESLLDFAGAGAYSLVGFLAMAESGLFVGLVIPGETAMILAGVLVFQGRVDLGWILLVACAGAVAGDAISFEIGRRYGARLAQTNLGRRVSAAQWRRARNYVRARGGRAVFFGRFVGVLRALVPAVAGWAGMPIRSFLVFNVAGGVLWAGGTILMGVAAGGSWRAIERWIGIGSMTAGAGVALAVVVVIGCILVRGRRRKGEPEFRFPSAQSSGFRTTQQTERVVRGSALHGAGEKTPDEEALECQENDQWNPHRHECAGGEKVPGLSP